MYAFVRVYELIQERAARAGRLSPRARVIKAEFPLYILCEKGRKEIKVQSVQSGRGSKRTRFQTGRSTCCSKNKVIERKMGHRTGLLPPRITQSQ